MKYNSLILILHLYLISQSLCAFQEDLFVNIYEKNEDKNIMISPFGLYQVLAILANGARGETQTEILQNFLSKEESKNTNNALKKINDNLIHILQSIAEEAERENDESLLQVDYDDLCEGDCNLIFNDINSFFVKNSTKIYEEFTSVCKSLNISFFELINEEQINNYCSENTNGKIKKIIDELDLLTSIIFLNILYFKASWYEPFESNYTKKRHFENINYDVVEVDTMYNFYESINYYEDDKVQMIALPYQYKSLDFKMIIILPNNNKYESPLEYFKKEKINYTELFSKLKYTKNVHLYLPKFEYEFQEDNLTVVLNNLGMNLKDFGNIIPNIEIKEIIQKTFIKIDEEGTEAAAVTITSMFTAYEENPKYYYMHVNHSFIYAIVSDNIKDSNNNYLIPFVGVVNNLEGTFVYKKEKVNKKDESNSVLDESNSTLNELVNIGSQIYMKKSLCLILALILL